MANLDYDYIIIGAGAAGLMLADAMGKDTYFSKMSILLLDKDTKNSNDRTWCFWEKGKGTFDEILYKKWNHITFKSQNFSKNYDIGPYSYKMVRGIDFYSEYLGRINDYANITFIQEGVKDIKENPEKVLVSTPTNTYTCRKVFDSRFDYTLTNSTSKYPVLQQHFVGWVIKTKTPIFDVDKATYMNFSIPQRENTRFIYVLPFEENVALVEYTLFSESVLPKKEYEAAIQDYIKEQLNCEEFEILEKEQGNIPMTCFDFTQNNTERVLHIGTGGGWAKPSTGYTFMSTSKKIPQLVNNLKSEKDFKPKKSKKRFWFYDLLFLDVLHSNNAIGHQIFTSLFQSRRPQLIFKFLDEETNLWEEIYYILGCPKMPFLKAFFKRLF